MHLNKHFQPSLYFAFIRNILIALAIGASIIFALLTWISKANTDFLVRDGLYGQAEEIAEKIIIDNNKFHLTMHQPMEWAYDAFFANLKYRILDSNGTVVLSSESTLKPLLPKNSTYSKFPDYFTIDTENGLLHVANFKFKKNDHEFIVQTARSDRFSELAAEAIMPAVFETALLLTVGCTIIFLIAVLFAVKSVINQVKQVSSTAKNISTANIQERIPLIQTPKELIPLVKSFNEALDRIYDGFQIQKRFVANATHELKTPLAILKAQVELNTEGDLKNNLLIDINQLTRNVQQMLQLSRVEDHRYYKFEAINLFQLAQLVISSFSKSSELSPIQLELTGPSNITLKIDQSSVFTALRNLIENAIKHAEQAVQITTIENGYLVEDDGPGFAENIQALMFERFWREDATTDNGSGLGLSIVAEVASAHGGFIEAENLEPRGAQFKLILSN